MFRLQDALPGRYTGASEEELADRIGAAKAALGDRLFILGHHYQRDEVMVWADARGDSFGLSRLAAAKHDAEFIVFCGVHFMAESADIPVSYTHLDVYKRQASASGPGSRSTPSWSCRTRACRSRTA